MYEEEFENLADMTEYNKFSEYKTRLCTMNGKVYGIPFDSGAAALFYRIDLLEQAGFCEKDMQHLTWDRFIEIGMEVYEKRQDMPCLR